MVANGLFLILLFGAKGWWLSPGFGLPSIDCEDLTGLPLLDRKRRLLRIMPFVESRLMYLDHIEQRGCDLFRVACERDLEGVVGKFGGGT